MDAGSPRGLTHPDSWFPVCWFVGWAVPGNISWAICASCCYGKVDRRENGRLKTSLSLQSVTTEKSAIT
jgi:hypothetical protein